MKPSTRFADVLERIRFEESSKKIQKKAGQGVEPARHRQMALSDSFDVDSCASTPLGVYHLSASFGLHPRSKALSALLFNDCFTMAKHILSPRISAAILLISGKTRSLTQLGPACKTKTAKIIHAREHHHEPSIYLPFFFCIFAHVSFSETVRLKTSLSAVESGSTQK